MCFLRTFCSDGGILQPCAGAAAAGSTAGLMSAALARPGCSVLRAGWVQASLCWALDRPQDMLSELSCDSPVFMVMGISYKQLWRALQLINSIPSSHM